MGSSQSQEDRSQTFSTIGLPSPSAYSRQQERSTTSASVPREEGSRLHSSLSSSRHYRSNATAASSSDDSNEWLRIERPPTTSVPLPSRPPPPRAQPSQDSRPIRRVPPHPPSHSLPNYEEFDLEQLLSTLQSLHLSSRRPEGSLNEPDSTERRRRRHHRLRNARAPILFLRSQPSKCARVCVLCACACMRVCVAWFTLYCCMELTLCQ